MQRSRGMRTFGEIAQCTGCEWLAWPAVVHFLHSEGPSVRLSAEKAWINGRHRQSQARNVRSHAKPTTKRVTSEEQFRYRLASSTSAARVHLLGPSIYLIGLSAGQPSSRTMSTQSTLAGSLSCASGSQCASCQVHKSPSATLETSTKRFDSLSPVVH